MGHPGTPDGFVGCAETHVSKARRGSPDFVEGSRPGPPARSSGAGSDTDPTHDGETVMNGAPEMILWVGHPPPVQRNFKFRFTRGLERDGPTSK
jgi:hypothetical protein